MESRKMEYDSTLGGHVFLPSHVQSYHFAAECLEEIKSLVDAIQNPRKTKLAFQTLPVHMRRRAMSHDPRRLPRKVRQKHISQMAKSGGNRETKRPSRKFRRKPSNLLKEYLRRQRKHIWLETHIWHAKKFHMVEKWGYKLPYSSCDKTYRACYRASAKHCLLQDISYFRCLEVVGNSDKIIDGFSEITSPRVGLGIGARTYLSGKREGSITLFKKGMYPRGALSTVTFMWKSINSPSKPHRKLWIFVHPSCYSEILTEIISCFQFEKLQKISNIVPDNADGTPYLKKEDVSLPSMANAFERVINYTSSTFDLRLTELKDTMNKFRLTGPLSHTVLGRALKCKKVREKETNNWFKEYISSKSSLETHLEQSDFWLECAAVQSPSELFPNAVLGLIVEDPRCNRPVKRTKATYVGNEEDNYSRIANFSDTLSLSPMWDLNLRNRLCEDMMSTYDYCEQRKKNALVPGQRCKFEDDLQPIPVLLIQRPGSQNEKFKRLGYASGWDVIVPSGYGLPFWLCFVMWGAKPGALRELNSVSRESGQEFFLPDTIPGLKESAAKDLESRFKYFRLPPNKRCNFIKLGISSPFRCCFKQLVKEWAEKSEGEASKDCGFFVLRESGTLQKIYRAVQKEGKLPSLPDDCLVPVYLKMSSRGNVSDFSIICLPKRSDIKKHFKHIKNRVNDPVYSEPLHPDEKSRERKILRQKHKMLLKRLRGRRVRSRKRLLERGDRVTKVKANTSAIVTNHQRKMWELYLPKKPKQVRHQCSREVFGYVTQGDFSFTEATVCCIGYVLARGLQKLLAVCSQLKVMVLVRDTKSRDYRFATLHVNTLN